MGRPCAARKSVSRGASPSSADASQSRCDPAKACVQLHPARAEQIDGGGPVEPPRGGRARVGLAHLDQHRAAGQLAGEVDHDRVAVGHPAVDRGRDGGRGVHDHDVARGEERTEVR